MGRLVAVALALALAGIPTAAAVVEQSNNSVAVALGDPLESPLVELAFGYLKTLLTRRTCFLCRSALAAPSSRGPT